MRLSIKWSKHKKLLEDMICDSLKKRIKIHLTHYRAMHESESRFWITFDGREIFSISKMEWLNELDRIAKDYKNKSHDQDEYEYAEKVLACQDKYSIDDIQYALEDYLSMNIDDTVKSDMYIIRALSMIDKRLGKRRLVAITLNEDEHSLVKTLFLIRCSAEGVEINSNGIRNFSSNKI